MTTAIAKPQQPSPLQRIEHAINQGKAQIAAALPSFVKTERFIRVALTEVRNNPDLQKCDPLSVCTSIMKAAQLGLDIGSQLGQAYLVPFKGECTMIVGYRGLVNLVRRSGEVSTFYAKCVYEGDEFKQVLGTAPAIHHVPSDNPGKMTHVYAVCVFKDGSNQFEVMSHAEIERHRQRFSKMPNSQGWRDSFDEMAKKTVIRRIIKMLPITIEDPESVFGNRQEEPQHVDLDKFKAISAASDAVASDERSMFLKQADELLARAAEKQIDCRDILQDDPSTLPDAQLIALVSILRERVK